MYARNAHVNTHVHIYLHRLIMRDICSNPRYIWSDPKIPVYSPRNHSLLSPTRSCLHQSKLHTINEKGSRLQTYAVFGFDVVFAECGCPAGMGPHASCKHIGGLCYALQVFTRIGKYPQYLTCTDKLQEWNKPRPKR